MIKKKSRLFAVLAMVFAGSLFILTPISALASSSCSHLKGCDRKFCEIENQLKISQEKGNKNKADGLQKALEEAKKYCTDEGLRKDLMKEIAEAKEDMSEYQADLTEAEEDGKTDKVRKYQEKIKAQRSEIKDLERELISLD